MTILAPWLRDLGSMMGLIVGTLGLLKGVFGERPFLSIEPEGPFSEDLFRLRIYNPTKTPIIIETATDYARGRSTTFRPSTSIRAAVLSAMNGRLDTIIDPEQSADFDVQHKDRDAGLNLVIRWQKPGALPWPRVPLLVIRTAAQMRALASASNPKLDPG